MSKYCEKSSQVMPRKLSKFVRYYKDSGTYYFSYYRFRTDEELSEDGWHNFPPTRARSYRFLNRNALMYFLSREAWHSVDPWGVSESLDFDQANWMVDSCDVFFDVEPLDKAPLQINHIDV